ITCLYQSTLSLPTVLPTPLNADSIANGTRIDPSVFVGILEAEEAGTMAYCQRPFRFTQWLRVICGRGYSFRGLFTSTLLAHSVRILSPAGFHEVCAMDAAL